MRYKDLIEDITPNLEKKFGRVLFGDFQHTHGIRSDHEKDTEYEEEVFKTLNMWFGGQSSRQEVQATIKGLSKLKDNYPTLLKPEPSSKFPYLYRGLYNFDISTHDYKNAFIQQVRSKHASDDDNIETMNIKTRDADVKKFKPHKQIEYIKDSNQAIYKPIYAAESWTVSLKMAVDILVNHFGEPPNDVMILKAKVPDSERLFSLRFTNKVYVMKQFEVVRVSKQPIKCEIFHIKGDDPYEI